MRLVWSESARRDLRAQIFFLAERNPDAARRVQAAIRDAVERLSTYPHRGRPGRRDGTRELIVVGLPYVIIYAMADTELTILRVLHAAQDWSPDTE